MTDTRSSSPLRHLDMSHDELAKDIIAEKARELRAAYDLVEELQIAIKGLLGLCASVSDRPDVSYAARQVLKTHQSVTDAKEILR